MSKLAAMEEEDEALLLLLLLLLAGIVLVVVEEGEEEEEEKRDLFFCCGKLELPGTTFESGRYTSPVPAALKFIFVLLLASSRLLLCF